MKKIMSFLIFINIIFGLIGCKTSEEIVKTGEITKKENKVYKEYKYTENEDYIKIERYSGEDEKVVIPESINGKPVKALGNNAFYQRHNMKELVIPETVATMEGSIYKCYSLESLFIHKDLIIFDNYPAFKCLGIKEITVDKGNKNYCDIDGVMFSKDKKKLIYYPEGRQNESYTVPESIEKIEYDAFGYYNEYLKRLTILSNVKELPAGGLYAGRDLNPILIVEKDSEAERYAIENNTTFEYIEN